MTRTELPHPFDKTKHEDSTIFIFANPRSIKQAYELCQNCPLHKQSCTGVGNTILSIFIPAELNSNHLSNPSKIALANCTSPNPNSMMSAFDLPLGI